MSGSILKPRRVEDVEAALSSIRDARSLVATEEERQRLVDHLWLDPQIQSEFGERDVLEAYLRGSADGSLRLFGGAHADIARL